jgi:ABC-type multidrug transport system ATPase subunit
MAKPDASFADVVRAAQLAGAEEFIERLPRGYDTVLEEGATNLSGGQRQRLALARALLIDPPVLILDEATSALDAESEAIVNANLKRMAKGRTVLSISHRLSMLVECDAILVLERGKVYDLGTHEELLQRCDIYKHMWYQQNRHLDPRAADKPLVVSRGRLDEPATRQSGQDCRRCAAERTSSARWSVRSSRTPPRCSCAPRRPTNISFCMCSRPCWFSRSCSWPS